MEFVGGNLLVEYFGWKFLIETSGVNFMVENIWWKCPSLKSLKIWILEHPVVDGAAK